MKPDIPENDTPRIRREKKTISVMLQLFCNDNHNTPHGSMCEDCKVLLHYASRRIDRCPYQVDKPTCVNCPVHCYKRVRREEMRKVMRYSGPKMIRRHPLLAIMHIIDGFRKAEDIRKKK